MGINAEQLRFYWTLGRDIVNMHIEERWGQSIINQLSRDLTNKLDRKGFSVTSLGYMRRFYQLYPNAIPTLPPAGGEMHSLTLTIPIHKVALNMAPKVAPKVAPKKNWPKDTADCWRQ